jgi:hypothetical protein
MSISGFPNGNELTIAMLQDGKWLSVPTTQTFASGGLSGSITQLGVFSVMRREDVDGESAPVPTQYALEQNYPNPFNPSTTIEFEIPRPSRVRLIVYDLLGKEVVRLVDSEMAAIRASIRFDASGIPSGVYFYRLTADGYSRTRKLIVLK